MVRDWCNAYDYVLIINTEENIIFIPNRIVAIVIILVIMEPKVRVLAGGKN